MSESFKGLGKAHCCAFLAAASASRCMRFADAQDPQPGSIVAASAGGASSSASSAFCAAKSAATSSPAKAMAINSRCDSSPPGKVQSLEWDKERNMKEGGARQAPSRGIRGAR